MVSVTPTEFYVSPKAVERKAPNVHVRISQIIVWSTHALGSIIVGLRIYVATQKSAKNDITRWLILASQI